MVGYASITHFYLWTTRYGPTRAIRCVAALGNHANAITRILPGTSFPLPGGIVTEEEMRIKYEYKSRVLYSKECEKCHAQHRIRTQHDGDGGCEYMTDVYLECEHCGDWVHFSLPVN